MKTKYSKNEQFNGFNEILGGFNFTYIILLQLIDLLRPLKVRLDTEGQVTPDGHHFVQQQPG